MSASIAGTVEISKSVRTWSQQTCVRHSFWNGLGVGFLYGDIIAVIALFYGAKELHMSLLFGVIYMSLPAALLAPLFLAGRDCTTIWRSMWLLRTLIIPLYFLLPILPAPYRAWFIVGIYAAFCILRSIGVSASLPVMRRVSTCSDRQALFGRHMQAFMIACMFVTITAYAVLEGGLFAEELTRYQVLIALGGIFSLVSTVYLYKLPHTGPLESISMRELLAILTNVMRDHHCRHLILITLGNTFILVLCGQVIPHMKSAMKINSGGIVLLCSSGLFAAAIAMHVFRNFGSRLNTFKLLAYLHAAIACSMIFLALSGGFLPSGNVIVFIPAIALLYVSKSSAVAIITSLQADSLPTIRQYAYSAIFLVASAFSAALAVCVVFVVQNELGTNTSCLPAYVFCICAAASMGLCLFVLRISRGCTT